MKSLFPSDDFQVVPPQKLYKTRRKMWNWKGKKKSCIHCTLLGNLGGGRLYGELKDGRRQRRMEAVKPVGGPAKDKGRTPRRRRMSYGTQRNPPRYPIFLSISITNWHYTQDNHWIYCFIVVLEDKLETIFHCIFVWTIEWQLLQIWRKKI